MTGQDFLTVAEALLAESTEAYWRSAGSRAYYAAFHAARDFLRALGFDVPKAEAAHKYLAFRLQNCGNGSLKKSGADLDGLRQSRNRADYDFSGPYTKIIADEDLADARAVVAALEAVTDEPTRTAVRDAIRVYERDVLKQVTWKP